MLDKDEIQGNDEFEKNDEEDKYNAVRDLIEEKKCPTIIYVSRTRKAYALAERLSKDGLSEVGFEKLPTLLIIGVIKLLPILD